MTQYKEIPEKTYNSIRYFVIAGYEDYLASRHLLNHTKFIKQAVIHASTAVELYTKAIILFSKGEVKNRVHLGALSKIKEMLLETEYENLFSYFDQNFIKCLGEGYKMRYLEGIDEDRSIGFFINQFLGELDFTIAKLNMVIRFPQWETHMATDYREKNEQLMLNNWFFNKWDKNEFMQPISNFFVLAFHKDTYTVTNGWGQLEIPGYKKYDGIMAFATVNYKDPEPEENVKP